MISVQIGDEIYKCATSWHGCTVRQFFQLKGWDTNDMVALVAILTGAPYEVVACAKQVDIDEILLPYLTFLEKEMPANTERLTHISIEGKEYKVPTDLGQYSFVQKIRLQERMVEIVNNTGSTVDAIPFAVAVYFQPIVQGVKYDTDKATEFANDVVMDCSITEAWAVANFFLKRLADYQNEIPNILRQNRTGTKLMRKLTGWMYSKNTKPLMRWPVGTS